MKLHCIVSIVTYQTVNILSLGIAFTKSEHRRLQGSILWPFYCFWSTLTLLLKLLSCSMQALLIPTWPPLCWGTVINYSNILSFVHFAHDTTVYVQHDSIDVAIQILNSELAKVAEWFDSNKLTLNVNKTQMLMMSRKKNLNPQGDVILCSEAIQKVTKAKFLGVTDLCPNWRDHVSMVSHKLFKSCSII